MDRIFIEDLLARGVIGVSDRERSRPQDILVNLTVFTEVQKAEISDDINNCTDYRTIAKKVFSLVENSKRHTVEALATDIANLVLQEPYVRGVKVRVEKPGAVRFSKSAGVEIERYNP